MSVPKANSYLQGIKDTASRLSKWQKVTIGIICISIAYKAYKALAASESAVKIEQPRNKNDIAMNDHNESKESDDMIWDETKIAIQSDIDKVLRNMEEMDKLIQKSDDFDPKIFHKKSDKKNRFCIVL